MEVYDNDGGGKTFVLDAGDDLRAVPRSHRKLVTDDIRKVLEDPPAYFTRMAKRTPFPKMAAWLHRILETGGWQLKLARGSMADHYQAGFSLKAPEVRGATVGMPDRKPPAWVDALPDDLVALYEMVGFVDWMGFGTAGSVFPLTSMTTLTIYEGDFRGDPIDPARTVIWGTDNGDNLIADVDNDRGGWFGLGWAEIRMMGTVRDTIDWLFGELLAGRGPSMANMPS